MNRLLAKALGTLNAIFAVILFLISLISAVAAGMMAEQIDLFPIFAFLIVFLIGIILTVLICGFISILVDIKNTLHFMAENLGGDFVSDFTSVERVKKSRTALGYTNNTDPS